MSNIDFVTIYGTQFCTPPLWALLERHLIDSMNEAAIEFVNHYTRSDGTLIWRDKWPGMDGSDDAYESFHNFALFYALGGSEKVHELARREWDAITWQFTEYGQIYREFDAYYDWMHHGESYIYTYYYGLADPTVLKDRQRALRFAHFYTGDDPEAPNYDPELKLIRSPINGSRGPRLTMSAEDWVTHRPVLAGYPAPFDDIPSVDTPVADWNDDEVFAEILDLLNQRMAKGDVPLNLTSTSLITHAFLYTGEEKYRKWVLEYLNAWNQRTKVNNGIMPDNVGLSGKIGEYMDGKWWGGYYGWRWPHGAMNLLESTVIAGSNAVLLTGDCSNLELTRSQHDLLWSLGKEIDGVLCVPQKHNDNGWNSYGVMNPRLLIHIWNISMDDDDKKRILRLPRQEGWNQVTNTVGKGDQAHSAPWFQYIQGKNPGYPEKILEVNYHQHCRRLEQIRNDTWNPQEWDVHHWQQLNPVICEGLVQLTLGAPQHIYHGGLLHCRVRYFDLENKRPGLPESVAALVEQIHKEGIVLQIVNLDAQNKRELILQAGAFAEHSFNKALIDANQPERIFSSLKQENNENIKQINSKWLKVVLEPGCAIKMGLTMSRYVNTPSYETPWMENQEYQEQDILKPRKVE